MKYRKEGMLPKHRLFVAMTALMTIWLCFWSWRIIAPTMRWPMIGDASAMAYMGWLANHGMRLYTDVVDVQFPGSIMVYSAARVVFGKTDFGFRVFDLVVLGCMLLCMYAISRQEGKWFAAVFGFAYFLWVHTGMLTSRGDLGQRDFIIAAMMLAGTVAVLTAASSGEMKWMAVFGFLVGLSVTMKPNALVFLFLPLPCFREPGFRLKHWRAASLWFSAGLAVAFAVVLSYLLRHHALLAFFETTRRVLPLYYNIRQMTYGDMLTNLNYPSRILPVVVLSCIAVLILEPEIRRKNIQQVLLTGTLCGAISYLSQHKGAYYHREPCYAFFFLWAGWVLVSAALRPRLYVASAALFVLLATVATYPHFIRHPDPGGPQGPMLKQLAQIGALKRDGQVQCMDTGGVCTAVMLRAERAMTTGTMNSFLLFPATATPPVVAERRLFLGKLAQRPPEFIVITNVQWPFSDELGYDMLKNWPELETLLARQYSLRAEQAGMPPYGIGDRVYELTPTR